VEASSWKIDAGTENKVREVASLKSTWSEYINYLSDYTYSVDTVVEDKLFVCVGEDNLFAFLLRLCLYFILDCVSHSFFAQTVSNIDSLGFKESKSETTTENKDMYRSEKTLDGRQLGGYLGTSSNNCSDLYRFRCA
jgi:hypothetical protein